VNEDAPAGTAAPGGPDRSILLFPMFRSPVEIDIPAGEGPHGGDSAMLAQLFAASPPPDPWQRAASQLDGAASVLLGAAANRSIATGGPVALADLGAGLPARPRASSGSGRPAG
jgi:hypothetical protein